MDFERLKKDAEELFVLVDENIDADKEALKIDNKLLKNALKEQIPLQMRWESIVGTLYGYHEYAKTITDARFAEAFEFRMVNDNRAWSSAEAKVLAEADKSYVEAKLLQNKIFHVKKEAEAMLNTIESRKYILKDQTALVIASCENYII